MHIATRKREKGGSKWQTHKNRKTSRNHRFEATNSSRQHHRVGHSSVPNKARSTGGGREPAKRDRRSKEIMARVAEECKRKAVKRVRKNKRRNRPERRAAAKAIIVEHFDLLPFSTNAQ
ncbi:unnamed protein product [Ectocarpus sp. 12 AP-2014]